MQSIWLGLAFCGVVESFVDYGSAYPKYHASGQDITLDADLPYNNGTLKLSPEAPVLTLDYGTENAGFPFFNVLSLSAPTQIEVKYAEDFTALSNVNSDGPWTFSNGLSNTFRVETFNLSGPGRTESFFVQGGQRWQTIQLLTNTTVEFAAIGINSTASQVDIPDVPGKLSTANDVYNQIWDLGARVVQVACVDAGNAPSTWNVTSEGALIPGQQTAQYVKGTAFGNYTLAFTTKIVRGGTGWRVASGTSPWGAVFYLTSNYPEDSTYLNTNMTLLPPNSLVFGYGWSIVNQTTVETGWNQYFSVNTTIQEDVWYNISTTITTEGYEVSIDGTLVAIVPIAEAAYYAASRFGSGSAFEGTWGFGPWQDQSALFKDVLVTGTNGSTFYSDPLTTDSILADYSVASLDAFVCLDGAKRDRLVWAGDFYHTGKVIAASTARWDYILGSIAYVFSFQKQDEPYKGFVPISAALGQRPEDLRTDGANYGGLNDYQDLFLAAIGDYFWRTGNVTGLQPFWSQIKDLVSARLAYIDPYSGLVAGEASSYFLGPANGSAVTALLSYSLQSLIPLANALNDTTTATLFNTTASNLNQANNDLLWSDDLGTYALSLSAPSNYSLTSVAWTLLSHTANSSQAESMIAKLPSLRLGIGYKTSSSDADSNTTQLSPNILGMLLEGLFLAHRDFGLQNTTVAKTLLDDFWSKMVTQNEYYSGASWEYLYPDGKPGIQLFASLAHPWGAAPTYVLPEYVLGIKATTPGFRTWRFEPLLGSLGLREANGTVVTPFGGIEAGWSIEGNGTEAVVWVKPPKGTKATLVLPDSAGVQGEKRRDQGKEIAVEAGKETTVRVHGLRL